ncbi:uncharacterized protein MYCFIDRAFT_210207 [Pseudocercospora fijiensis CIRAD86]|uniref:Uncharacterized protein n=1 Tax=Pseudocercospora fijiensis (strain CIRAD86) TaxID=383855 RepID=M3B7P7_PSEFD|nr:uncharacterized protein MYCFIDRAFT_210207 [Pseudocercospora fijiensis CIRAD86]EME85343.1 hypothetical protein MYCFIDRAFT_210207 [Pseudocercospora fijiensis CIRAD86]
MLCDVSPISSVLQQQPPPSSAASKSYFHLPSGTRHSECYAGIRSDHLPIATFMRFDTLDDSKIRPSHQTRRN